MRVAAIRVAVDNYAYWVERIGGTIGFLIDAGAASEPAAFFKAKGYGKPGHIFTTHKHIDHCGGNLELASASTKIYAGEKDAPSVPGCATPLKDGETVTIDGLQVTALHVPCHTVGHVLYYVRATEGLANEKIASATKHNDSNGSWTEYSGGLNRALFTGDTIFVGGCGRFFEGTPTEMLQVMDKVLTLPDDLYLFSGHEYAYSNAKFAIQVEPHNPDVQNLLKSSQASEAGEFIIPSTLGAEKKHNVFMRCRTPTIQAILKCTDPIQCMKLLRDSKNQGTFPAI